MNINHYLYILLLQIPLFAGGHYKQSPASSSPRDAESKPVESRPTSDEVRLLGALVKARGERRWSDAEKIQKNHKEKYPKPKACTGEEFKKIEDDIKKGQEDYETVLYDVAKLYNKLSRSIVEGKYSSDSGDVFDAISWAKTKLQDEIVREIVQSMESNSEFLDKCSSALPESIYRKDENIHADVILKLWKTYADLPRNKRLGRDPVSYGGGTFIIYYLEKGIHGCPKEHPYDFPNGRATADVWWKASTLTRAERVSFLLACFAQGNSGYEILQLRYPRCKATCANGTKPYSGPGVPGTVSIECDRCHGLKTEREVSYR